MVTDSTRQALAVGAVIELVQAQMLVPNQAKPWAIHMALANRCKLHLPSVATAYTGPRDWL